MQQDMLYRLLNGVTFLLTPQLNLNAFKMYTAIAILPLLLSYISTYYTSYHTKAKTSVHYFSHKRNLNAFHQPGIAQMVDRFFQV